jgi:hypothetical protein
VINRIQGLGSIESERQPMWRCWPIEDGEFQLVDSQKNTVTAKQRIVSRLTICRGKRLLAPL